MKTDWNIGNRCQLCNPVSKKFLIIVNYILYDQLHSSITCTRKTYFKSDKYGVNDRIIQLLV